MTNNAPPKSYSILDFISEEEMTYMLIKYGDHIGISNAFTDALGVVEKISFPSMTEEEQRELMQQFFNGEIR